VRRRLAWLVLALLMVAALVVLLGAVIVLAALTALGVGVGVPTIVDRHTAARRSSR